MALTIASPATSFDSTHARVYREAALLMPQQDFVALSGRQPQLMQSAEKFQGILKYYEIKPGYLLMVRLFHALGFDLVSSTYLPSLVSYFLLGCLLLVWLRQLFDIVFASIITLGICALPFMVQTARYSSPDMLCAALLLVGIYFISENRFPSWGLLPLSLAIAVRPDAVILFLFLTLVLVRDKKISGIAATGIMILGSIFSFLMVGGHLLMDYVFTTSPYSPQWGAVELLTHYMNSLTDGLNSIMNSQTIVMMFLAVTSLFMRVKMGYSLSNDLWSLLVISSLATFVLRYLLHPVIEDRLMLACYLVIIIGFCKTIREVLPSRSRRTD